MDIPRLDPARLKSNFTITDIPTIELPWFTKQYPDRKYRLVEITNRVLNKALPLLVVTKKFHDDEFIIMEMGGTKWFTLCKDVRVNNRILAHMSFRRFYSALTRFEKWSDSNACQE